MNIVMKKIMFLSFCCLALFVLTGCITSNIRLFSDGTEPLREFVISGSGSGKILIVPVNGVISLASEGNFLRSRPGMVQETVSLLRLAERDSSVKAVLLMVNSPGGTVTASDMLYEELRRFKERTGKKLIVCMLDVAASGGYYISLPADLIYAHPTSITGSVGVIFMRPEINGLMKLIGVQVNTDKSGKFKDMGSPFRPETPEEAVLFNNLIQNMAEKFTSKVQLHRHLSESAMADVATAKVYTADGALKIGLIDRIGYVDDALAGAMKLAHLEDARVIVYRRDKYNNDNSYIMETANDSVKPLVNTGVIGQAASANAGFYFIWPAVLP